MKSYLITGGCGFIGSNFILELLESNDAITVVNLDALTYAGNPQNLESIEKDQRYHFRKGCIGDSNLVRQILKEFNIDTVVNFAAESHVDRSIDTPTYFIEANVLKTANFLETSRKHFDNLSEVEKEGFRFLHVSTDEVYGSLKGEDAAFSETTAYAPNSPYAASKASSDHIARAYYHTFGLPVLTTNCSNNYGPFQFPEKLIPLIIANAVEGKPLPIYGDGLNVRDWLYVRDHARAILAVLAKGLAGETYCIGGDSERDNLTVVKSICAILDRVCPKDEGHYAEQITFVKDRPGHDFRYAIDASKIHCEVDWKPSVSFETGLEETVVWYLSNKEWSGQIHLGEYQRERLGNL